MWEAYRWVLPQQRTDNKLYVYIQIKISKTCFGR